MMKSEKIILTVMSQKIKDNKEKKMMTKQL